jgi:hypothetical protein
MQKSTAGASGDRWATRTRAAAAASVAAEPASEDAASDEASGEEAEEEASGEAAAEEAASGLEAAEDVASGAEVLEEDASGACPASFIGATKVELSSLLQAMNMGAAIPTAVRERKIRGCMTYLL